MKYDYSKNNERAIIVCAAAQNVYTKQVIASPRHFDDIMREQMKAAGGRSVWLDAEQGFVDQFCNFYTREETLVVATRMNQIKTKHGNPSELYSDDLY